MQLDEPVLVWNWPPAQLTQVAALAEDQVPPGQGSGYAAPALQDVPAPQDAHEVEPEAERYLPAGQLTQLEAPAVARKDPAGQSEQLDAPGREYDPAGHTNAAYAAMLADGQKKPPGQGRQSEAWQSQNRTVQII